MAFSADSQAPTLRINTDSDLWCVGLRLPTASSGVLLALICCTAACSTSGSNTTTQDSDDIPHLELSELDIWNCGPSCFLHRYIELERAQELASDSPGARLNQELKLVYPLSGSVHPRNLQEITFQWSRPTAQVDTFMLHVHSVETSAKSHYFFVPCEVVETPLECTFTTPWENWSQLAAEAAEGPYVVELAGSTSDGNVVRAEPVQMEFSPEPVAGGFYYWSTALRGTYRLPFGAQKAVPWIEPGSARNPSDCGGCHAVSRDGTVLAFTSVTAAGYLRVVRAANPEVQPIASESERNSSMLALNTDGSLVATAYENALTVRNTQTGEIVVQAAPGAFGGKSAYFPEFSPDGSEIVVTLSDSPDAFWSVASGELAAIPFDGTTFGQPRALVPMTDEFHYYPSWSPDGQWVVFVSAPKGRLSYDQALSRLRLVHRTGGEVYELTRATRGSGNTSTWPKFAPFVQADGNMMFITFNTKIDYGFLLKNSELRKANVSEGQTPLDPSTPLNKEHPQLWLSAIDFRKLSSGDPSSSPVWLPFQELDQRNHLGYWTTQVSCEEDLAGGCGAGEVCEDGSCKVVLR